MIVPASTVKVSHKECLLRHIKNFVAEIPLARRQSLAEEIRANSAIFGCKDSEVLEEAISLLKGD